MSNSAYIIGLLELFQGKISYSELVNMELPLVKELQISKNNFLAEQQKAREKMQKEQEAAAKRNSKK